VEFSVRNFAVVYIATGVPVTCSPMKFQARMAANAGLDHIKMDRDVVLTGRPLSLNVKRHILALPVESMLDQIQDSVTYVSSHELSYRLSGQTGLILLSARALILHDPGGMPPLAAPSDRAA
jgi:hypothetical protein